MLYGLMDKIIPPPPIIHDYDEDFSSYLIGTPLTDNPPNYIKNANLGTAEVGTNWGVNAAKLIDTGDPYAGTRGNAIYMGATFSYIDMSIRCATSSSIIPSMGIFFRHDGDTTNPWGNNGYMLQIQASPILFWKIEAGIQSPVIFNFSPPAFDFSDFNIRILASGSSLKAYLNGTEILNGSDATFASGKIGFQAFNNSTVYITDIIVN